VDVRQNERITLVSRLAGGGGVRASQDGVDVYVGVGLSPKNYGINRRCLQKDIISIPALWIDIDVQDAVHKKPNLPGSISEAMKLFDWLEHKPTITVNSGHGLQAWWVFREPWTFDSDGERQEAQSLARRFVQGFRQHAKALGWDVDAVHNLDRVLRVPGTVNHKSEPVPVKLLECNDLRYNPSDFEEILPDMDEKDYAETDAVLVLSPDATPPFDKFEALKEIETKFRQSWEHKRKDMQDQSASSYDLSLANFAAMAGWNEQEIADLLIAHRRQNNEDLKLREDYYKRTIGIAMKNIKKLKAEEEIVQEVTSDKERDITPERREALLQTLSAMFGVRLLQIIKYTTDPPAYRLVTDSGNISLGDVENLIGQGKLRNKLAAATGKYLPRFKADRWDNIAPKLLDVCVKQDVGEEATERGQAQAWLEQYLAGKTLLNDPAAASVSGDPFRVNNKTYMFGADFQKWIRIVNFEKITSKQLGTMLRAVGAEPEKINIEAKNRRTTRSVWCLKTGQSPE